MKLSAYPPLPSRETEEEEHQHTVIANSQGFGCFCLEKRGYVLMILPQVHLRKPCYDFYFL